jgi:hypothetical protein
MKTENINHEESQPKDSDKIDVLSSESINVIDRLLPNLLMRYKGRKFLVLSMNENYFVDTVAGIEEFLDSLQVSNDSIYDLETESDDISDEPADVSMDVLSEGVKGDDLGNGIPHQDENVSNKPVIMNRPENRSMPKTKTYLIKALTYHELAIHDMFDVCAICGQKTDIVDMYLHSQMFVFANICPDCSRIKDVHVSLDNAGFEYRRTVRQADKSFRTDNYNDFGPITTPRMVIDHMSGVKIPIYKVSCPLCHEDMEVELIESVILDKRALVFSCEKCHQMYHYDNNVDKLFSRVYY